MTRRIISTVAALALAGIVSTASAQDAGMQAGVAVKPTYQVFVTSVNATPATLTALKARPAITANEVTLVNLRDFPEASDSAVVVLVQPHTTEIEQLRAVLEAQAEVKGLFAKQTPVLTAADVVAVGTTPDGKVLVFYRPKGM
jgi:hypothetical protein